MVETDQEKSEEDRFNETLKRMLKTPPDPKTGKDAKKKKAVGPDGNKKPTRKQPPR